VLDLPPKSERLGELAQALGCATQIDAIAAMLLASTRLPQDEHEAVRSTVEHLVGHEVAWRSMAQGVIPPAVRAQTLSAIVRSSETAPGDMLVALLFATIRDALRCPG
jgi:hypothetical protein